MRRIALTAVVTSSVALLQLHCSGAGGPSDDTTNPSGACLSDEPSKGAVTFRVTNKDSKPRFLSKCGGEFEGFEIKNADGFEVAPFQGPCVFSCGQLRTQPRVMCGDCAHEAVKIEPGASVDVPWDGRAVHRTWMNTSCFEKYDPPPEEGRCTQLVATPPGRYRVEMTSAAAESGPTESAPPVEFAMPATVVGVELGSTPAQPP